MSRARLLAGSLVLACCACSPPDAAPAQRPEGTPDAPPRIPPVVGRPEPDPPGAGTGAGTGAGDVAPPLRPLWARSFQQLQRSDQGPTTSAPATSGLAAGPGGRAVLGGSFLGGAAFGEQHLPESESGAPTPFVASYGLDGRLLFVKPFTPGGSVRTVAVAPNDEVLAAGRLDAGEVVLARLAADGGPRWGLTANPGRGGGSAEVTRLAVDKGGHAVLAGTFSGEVTLGAQPLRAKGGPDVLLARVDPTGAVLWATSMGSAGDDEAVAVAVAPGGEIALLSRTVGGEAGPAPTYCLARYSPEPRHQWSRCFATPHGSLALSALAVDQTGALLVAGRMTGQLELGGARLASEGDSDAMVARFAPDGSHVFSRRIGGPGPDEATDLAVTPAGDLALVGRFSGKVDFGATILRSEGRSDGFVALYDGAGGPIAARAIGGGGEDRASQVVVDGDDLLVAGQIDQPSPLAPRDLLGPGGFLLRLAR